MLFRSPGVVLNDELREKLEEIFLEYFQNFMPEFTGYYIEQTDKGLKLEQVSKRTTAWVKTWSGQLADIMQLLTDWVDRVTRPMLWPSASLF